MDVKEKRTRRIIADSDEEEGYGQHPEQNSTESFMKPDSSAVDASDDGEDEKVSDDDDLRDTTPAAAANNIIAAEELNDLFNDNEDDEGNQSDSITSRQENRAAAEEEDDDEDIFGEDSDDDNRNAPVADDDQEVEDMEEIEQREIELAIPRYPKSHIPESDIYFSRVPAFLSIDPRPFDPTTFLSSTVEEMKNADNNDKSQRIRLKNENTVRWKYGKDESGDVTMESNARFVRWSDGTTSLQLGNELFDISEKTVQDTFLGTMHEDEEILQVAAIVNKNMTFVPTSTSSRTHKRLTEALNKKQEKQASVSRYATTDDPDKIRREAEKAEDASIRARRKLESKRKLNEDRMFGLGSQSGGSQNRYERVSTKETSYVNGDGYEEDDFIVNDEESDEEEEKARRLKELKRKGSDNYKRNRDYDEDEDEEEDFEGEEEEEEEEAEFTDEERSDRKSNSADRRTSSGSSQNVKKRRVISDDEDDE
ncbi:Leo1-domain-containing protein [Nadsonia fulvescens var. elongata DSM 6958]|uniref:Leo1-domain-containing protein n=1 Tax=Nadsonia fulvescens var. elongata DSM 6958 TaxID=857566 RepID=A0A1E3PMB7_9ASCO|nr:Leo1-domain-containing protein [Nadsonia fulvescens var. elongata DSM 6958]